jgi:putative LysE/RhtB family amino acid efflux pump
VSAAFVLGFGLGVLVAAQIGPMSLLLIRSTLRGGVVVGLAIGAGIALVDALYATAGAAGAASLLAFEPLHLALGLAGGTVLAWLGARTLWSAFRVRMGAEAASEVATPRRAFGTSVAATASNPLTIASWTAVFAAASTAGAADTLPTAAALLLGVGLGSLTSVAALACGVAAGRRLIGDRVLRCIDILAGAGLVAFGGLLAARTLRDG